MNCLNIKFIKTVRILMIIILFPAINIITQTHLTYEHLKDLNAEHDSRLVNVKELKWLFIETVIKENKEKAKIQVNDIKDKIEVRLINEYKDNMDQLKIDLLNNTETKALKIMNEEISGKYLNVSNDKNDLFITTTNRIIIDKSIKESTDTDYKCWQDEIVTHPNQYLSNQSMKLILNKSKEVIYWKSSGDVTNFEKKMIYPSMDFLKQIFMEHDIEGLKNYEFLTPAYIKKDTDIFGVPDTNNIGVKTDNLKIIVVQEFNIVDALKLNYSSELSHFTHLKNTIEKERTFKISKISIETFMNLALLIASFMGIFLVAKILIKRGGDDVRGEG